jgi:hypothetical protein
LCEVASHIMVVATHSGSANHDSVVASTRVQRTTDHVLLCAPFKEVIKLGTLYALAQEFSFGGCAHLVIVYTKSNPSWTFLEASCKVHLASTLLDSDYCLRCHI